ncbi:MAG: YebC/PmpR family DNA-binding transcriptional regulator [Saprospiraceae bacterium]|nr:YebC/PmpR family DNA-binding transcriptional regulator [Saprospiraceae bacterium]
MSGHSKWSKIKRKKGAADAKRSKEFSRILKEITVAVKEGQSGEPDFNPRLRVALANAKGVNVPKENIERAISKALASSGEAMFEPTYEGYAPHGVAVFVECTTDNLNRTVSSVRAIFNKKGGNLSTSGSVDFLFDRKGIFILPVNDQNIEELELELIDANAEEVDFDEEANEIHVVVAFEDFGTMQKKLDDLGLEATSANLERIPRTTVTLPLDEAKSVLQLVEALEEDEDVSQVFHNLEFTEEVEAALSAAE